MEKAALVAKPKPQRSNTETLPNREEQTQEAEHELSFQPGSSWVHHGGREIDLSIIPAYSNLSVNENGELGEIESVKENNEEQVETIRGENEETQRSSANSLIADDSAIELREGQMRKTEFLQQLRKEICNTIEPVLASVGQTTDDCPYLNYWLGLYQEKDAAHIERTARKYAPAIIAATTASEYISIIAKRALRAAVIWSRTGRITGVPDDVPSILPGENKNEQRQGTLIQFKAKTGGIRNADDPAIIQKDLGEGQPLAAGVRSRMESAFGVDLSQVRTHTDSTAGSISNRVNARAFTVGSHIAFGDKEYQPGTLIGDALIAHELAHTIQQKGAESSVDKLEAGDEGYDALERDADQTAIGVVSSLWDKENSVNNVAQKTFARLRSGLRLQRCGGRQRGTVSGPCGQTSKARTYTLTEMDLNPAPLNRQFGATDRGGARVNYAACEEGSDWKFYLDSLVVPIKSQVQPEGFRTEVASATDPIVTSSTFREIIRDLRPNREATYTTTCGDGSWSDTVNTQSLRSTYWRRQFVIDHEAFHRTDWDSKFRPELIAAEQQVWGHTVPRSQAASASAALRVVRATFNGYFSAAYQRACQNYGPQMETRAYNNGVPQYQGLVDAVQARAQSEGWVRR